MGLVSLSTNQFWSRVLMFFMQPQHYPIEPFTVNMRPRRMLLFTAIQLGLFVLLYVVKAIKMIAIAFPLVIACCIPIRVYLLPKIFTEKELVMIDSDDDAVKAFLVGETDGLLDGNGDKGEDKPHKGVGGDDEDEEGEARDQVSELPAGDTAGKVPERRRRGKRRKTVSCPPHMLFAEVPLNASHVDVAFIEEEVVEEREEDEEAAAPTATEGDTAAQENLTTPVGGDAQTTTLRRRRRKKTVSCPAQMLFAEAERQVAANYFFG